MKYLILLTTILSGCITNEICEDKLTEVYLHHRYVSYGNYDIAQYKSADECQEAVIEFNNNPGPSYCTSEWINKEVCK